MSSKKLAALVKISQMLLEAEQAKLSQAAGKCQSTRGKLSGLDNAVKRQNDVISKELEMPVAGPVLDLWGGWAERRRMTLNTELARQTVDLEEQRQNTQVAFGRAEALKNLDRQAHIKELRLTKNRARRA